MKAYIDILKKILSDGTWKQNRTGIDTLSITGAMFEHDLNSGFPLLTTKQMGLKNIATELEFFIKGLSDKKWLQDRKCYIWDDWANPQKVPYGNDDESKRKMKEENDLGCIYGVQWRNWNNEGIDQLKNIIDKLKTNPYDRRMIVNAWNPSKLDQMALPPCHYSFQILSDGENVDLLFNMRSTDTFLGAPYNIASYGLLLEIIAKHVKMKPRKLIGFWADTHLYKNHIEQVSEQIKRNPLTLPKIEITCDDIFNWTRSDFILSDYESHSPIKGVVAV
jgi:thymidylate synthase